MSTLPTASANTKLVSPKDFAPPLGKHTSSKSQRDTELVRRILDHQDERAYTTLMDIYQKAIYRLVSKIVPRSDVAEDLTLEVFVRAFRALHTYKPEFAFSTWLYRIATNYSIAYLHQHRPRTVSLNAPQFAGEEAGFDLPDTTPTAQEAIIQLQRSERMHSAVDRLPAKYQSVMTLHYFEELSYEEIAERQHVPLGTVKGQLHRGRNLLHHLMVHEQEII